MKPKELIAVGSAYLLGTTIAYFVLRHSNGNPSSRAQVFGTILGVLLAAWLYQSRNRERAPVRVKFTVGALLGVLCGVQGLVFHWMPHSDVGILCGAILALVFPFLVWNRIGGITPYRGGD